MIKLHNDFLKVEIDEMGAQLHHLVANCHDYLWPGDPQSWKRKAPVLFPFVGRLKDDQYEYQGQEFHQTQHGFARDLPFTVVKQAADYVALVLSDNQHTRQAYPFAFKLSISYRLVGRTLQVSYDVENPDDQQTLIYAIGAHPGFHLPFSQAGNFDDLQLSIDQPKTYQRINLVAPGPASDLAHPSTIDLSQPLQLHHDLFKNDAIVLALKQQPATISVYDPLSKHGVRVHTVDNPYVGIWSPYPAQADLVCIEPWWGIADTTDSDGQLEHKAAMHRLAAGDSHHYRFNIEPF